MSVQDAQEAQEAQDEQEVQDALMVHYAWLNATILPFTLDQLAEETSEFRRQVYVAGVGECIDLSLAYTHDMCDRNYTHCGERDHLCSVLLLGALWSCGSCCDWCFMFNGSGFLTTGA